MKKLAQLVLLAFAACASVRAQSFDLQQNRLPVLSIDGFWRFHTGDDPGWASPGFDDSHWTLLHSNRPWTDQGYKGYGGIAWYRFHVTVPTNMDHLSLYLPRIFTCYEAFANGQRVGAFGKMPPNTQPYDGGGDFRLYELPPGIGSRGSIEIALRIWQTPRWAGFEDAGPLHGGALIGDSIELRRRDGLYWESYQWYLVSEQTLGFIELLAGLGALLLFVLRRSEAEYIWFGLFLLFSAASLAFDLYSAHAVLNLPLRDIVADTISGAVSLASIAFYQTLLKPRRTWLLTFSIVCICLAILVAPLAALFPQVLTESLSGLAEAVLSLPMFLWVLSIFVTAVRRNSQDARLLVFPVFLSIGVTLFVQITWITYTLGWQSRFWRTSIVLSERPFRIELGQITDLLFLLGVFAILILRFTRARSQEECYACEIDGARSVQQFLIPSDLPQIPDLTIESAYHPAREVGGDFFQILPDTDGSTLIVVGDVAGKGLEAGMLATLIVGAVRTAVTFTADPALILATLNNRLYSRGNATCLVLRIDADGAATLVNAGHLPPYLNGRELPMEGALPLGTLPGIDFPVLRFRLNEGDSLMLMSDGIAEAQRPDGELFGFDRIADLLHQNSSAASLAAAAQRFGQEDDITVLTLTRQPQPVTV